MVPDRLPAGLRQILREFPAGSLQFEVGIQTFNAEVSNRIQRRQDYPRIEDNLRFLRAETAVYLHVDLIAGLPGETWQSFASGFDRLIALGPQEIQVGLLKRLRGTPIIRHDQEWGMVYNPNPPYEILQTAQIDFPAMQRLRRFARFWDLIGNSGNFIETIPLLWQGQGSPFDAFISLADHLFARFQRTDSIALDRLAEAIFEYLTERGMTGDDVGPRMARDYGWGGRKNLPSFLEPYGSPSQTAPRRAELQTLKRQSRRLATGISESGVSGM